MGRQLHIQILRLLFQKFASKRQKRVSFLIEWPVIRLVVLEAHGWWSCTISFVCELLFSDAWLVGGGITLQQPHDLLSFCCTGLVRDATRRTFSAQPRFTPT